MKQKKLPASVASLFLSLGFLLLPATPVAVADNTWDGGGGSGLWSDLANWGGDTSPVSPTLLTFAGTSQLNNTNDLFAAGTLFNGFTFTATAGAFVIGGNSITLGGNVTNSSSNLQTLNLDLILNGTRTVTATSDLTMGGSISETGGSFGLVKAGAGVLTLSGSSNSFTGASTISAGTVKLGSASGLGATGNIVTMSNGSTLQYAVNTAANQYAISGGAAVAGSNRTIILDRATAGAAVNQTISSLTLAGASTAGGETLTTNVGANVTSGTSTLFVTSLTGGISARTIHLAGNATYSIGSATGASNATATTSILSFDGTSLSNAVTGVISNNNAGGGLNTVATIVGGGRWTFSNTNTYTGTTSINAGVLDAVDGVGLPTASILQIRGGVFQSSGTFTRAVSTAAGAVNYGSIGANAVGGGFAARGGVLNLQLNGGTGSLTWNGSSFVQTGQSLIFGSSTADNLVDFQNSINLGSSGTNTRTVNVIDNPNSTSDIARISGAITNTTAGQTLLKTGAGTLELTGASPNTYNGGTIINGGTLVAGKDGALGGGNVSLTGSAISLTLQNGATQNYIANTASLSIDIGNVNLNYTGTDTIGALIINGIAQAAGQYGAPGSGAANVNPVFTGTGFLDVTAIPEPSTWAMLVLGVTLLAGFQRVRRRA